MLVGEIGTDVAALVEIELGARRRLELVVDFDAMQLRVPSMIDLVQAPSLRHAFELVKATILEADT